VSCNQQLVGQTANTFPWCSQRTKVLYLAQTK